MDFNVLLATLYASVLAATAYQEESYCGNACVCDFTVGVVHCNNTEHSICLSQLFSEVSKNASSIVIDGTYVGCRIKYKYIENYTAIDSLEIIRSKLNRVDLGEDIISRLPDLKQLTLKDNEITYVNFSHLGAESNVEVLDLSHNGISSFDQDVFLKFVSLKELNLSYNRLFSLENTTVFQSLTSLHTLDLSHNQLTYIHPQTFHSTSALTALYLNSNALQSLQREIFDNSTLLEVIHLRDNPWDCHCGINWITEAMTRNPTMERYKDKEAVTCRSPDEYKDTRVAALNSSEVLCESPTYAENASVVPKNLEILYMGSGYLHCQAAGHPKPSVYWLGPRGVLVHASHHTWLPSGIDDFTDYQYWIGKPLYYETSVRALANGSLLFQRFRRNYEGEYVCIAKNPVGEIATAVNVTLVFNLKELVINSVIFGTACSLAATLIGFIIGSSQWIAEKTCCKKDKEESAIEHYYSEDIPPKTIRGEEDWYEYFKKLPYEYPDPTSRQSPMKCVTPAEPIEAEENRNTDEADIWQTLDDVRTNLRNSLTRQAEWVRSHTQTVKTDVGKKVERVRYKAQLIRQSGTHYVQHIRESSSTRLRTIRSSSSQYALRVRSGMVGTVEEVRGKVKSLKEFCGQGDIGQTMSVVSVSTNVDTQLQTLDFKSHTLV